MRSAIQCIAAALSVWAVPAAACWEAAAQRYAVSPQLLYAIARVESNLNPGAINLGHLARTGTYDIGLMQINSSHLSRLATYGISEADLYEPCTNIHVGAWLLSDAFARHGVGWRGVGAYNAACAMGPGAVCDALRAAYAWRVYRHLPLHSAASAAVPARGRAPQERLATETAAFVVSARVSP